MEIRNDNLKMLSLKFCLTVNNELSPHITSFNFLVGAQPRPSMEFCLSKLRQISPSSLMLGCHNFVRHFTVGGYEKNKTFPEEFIIS